MKFYPKSLVTQLEDAKADPPELQEHIDHWETWLASAHGCDFDHDTMQAILHVNEAARLVANLLTPEEISEIINSQTVEDGWFNPFHAQAVLLTIGMGDKRWSRSIDTEREHR
jgi:alkylhydroperoxidase/carboxymuconolactone decarboxylase family protein YurZ